MKHPKGGCVRWSGDNDKTYLYELKYPAKKQLLLIIFICLSYLLMAQGGIEKIEHYTIEDGLSNASITCILQDKRGFLWIATDWGLNRYDGRTFKQYATIKKNGLIDLAITALAEDAEGRLWLTTNSGVISFDPFTEIFTSYPFIGVEALYIDKSGTIWCSSTSVIYCFDRDKNKFQPFTTITLQDKETKTNPYVSDFFEDSRGRFWLATSYGIKLLDKKTRSYISYHFPETATHHNDKNSCSRMFEDSSGKLWVGTWGSGMLVFNEKENKFEQLMFDSHEGNDVNIVHWLKELYVNGKKLFIACTEHGPIIIEKEKIIPGKLLVQNFVMNNELKFKLASQNIQCVYQDKEKNYWIGTRKGLCKIDPRQQAFRWIGLPGGNADNVIYHIIKDIHQPDKQVYLTTQQGWWKMDMDSQTIRPFALPSKYFEILASINNYAATKDGYWFTSQTGFGFYDPYKQEVRDLTRLLEPDKTKSLRTGKVLIDRSGKIWFTVFRSGIRILDPATNKIIKLLNEPSPAGLSGKNIYDLQVGFP